MKKHEMTFITVAILLGLILMISLGACWSEKPKKKPEIAGQAVPDARFIIDFKKRYNIICSQYQGGRSYDNVRILGYTGTEVKESSGNSSGGYGHFNNWLVLERLDGRKVYLSIGGIAFLEETDQSSK